jgi:hypothetical protein
MVYLAAAFTIFAAGIGYRFLMSPARASRRWEVAITETPAQLLECGAWIVYLIVGTVLGLLALAWYPLIDGRVSEGLTIVYVVAFAASFWIVRNGLFPRATPTWIRVGARAGWALCTASFLFGVVGIANGAGSSVETRTVQCVAKRKVFSRGASHVHYLLTVLPSTGSNRRVEVEAPRSVYLSTTIGESVQVTIGRGNLGLEWRGGVSAAPTER